jgi:hypothetical protein
LGHSFVNPLYAKYRKRVAKCSSLFDPLIARLKAQSYEDLEGYVNEHILRAVTTRLTFTHFGEQAGEDALQYEKNRGFLFVEALCKCLERYEAQRDKYPSFEDFYPQIIKLFEELSKKNLGDDFYFPPFSGTIDNAYATSQSAILIVPTNEDDKVLQEKIHAYVKERGKRFLKEPVLMTDQEALGKDLSDSLLLVYGTVRGNLWLAQHLAELPVRIQSDKIVADTAYPGTHLRFITGWPNPQNPKKGVVIYTAQRAEDIVGINGVFHGPTDYVIARDTVIVKRGNYNKKTGKWMFK